MPLPLSCETLFFPVDRTKTSFGLIDLEDQIEDQLASNQDALQAADQYFVDQNNYDHECFVIEYKAVAIYKVETGKTRITLTKRVQENP